MKETVLNGETLDITEENIEKMRELFPEVFTEGKIDFEKLKMVLGDYTDDREERYNFTWHGKKQAIRFSQTPSLGTLRPTKEESKDWNITQNLYIEGDNLEVLKLLQKSYHGKVKMIYIDPPYNTGRDIIYKNDFHDSLKYYKIFTGQIDGKGLTTSTNQETSGRYHTEWLNMMYPRLRLSRTLLKDDGIIFITIDDYEVHNLIKIADEIFGEINRLAVVCVVHNPEGRNQAKFFGTSHEYAIVYAKNITRAKFRSVAIDDEILKKFDQEDEKGKYLLKNFIRMSDGKYSLRENKPNFYYPVYVNKALNDIKENPEPGYIAVYPVTLSGQERTWKTTKGTFFERYSRGEIIAKYNKGRIEILEKIRENQIFKTHWINKKYHAFHYGTKVLDALLEIKTFDFPKSVDLVKDSIEIVSEKEDIVLDFFSGSATTAHAVMKLNAEDGGNRKYIMIQLPEPVDEKSEAYKAGYKNICEIGKERIRRAGEKIKKEMGLQAENLDIGFKVLKLDTSNIRKWQPDFDNLEEYMLDYIDNFVEGRTELDVVYEIMLKYGLDLTYRVDEYEIKGKKIYSIGYGMLIICLTDEITTDLARGILEKIDELKPESNRIVFRDNSFKDDASKTNIKEIFKQGDIEEFITI